MAVNGFTAVLVRGGEVEILTEDDTINILDEAPSIESAVIGGKCQNCEHTNLLFGEYQGRVTSPDSDSDSPFHAIDCHAVCGNCNVDMRAEIEFAEFQRGVIQALQLVSHANYEEYVEIHGLKTAVSMN